jgi:hypothetical protein
MYGTSRILAFILMHAVATTTNSPGLALLLWPTLAMLGPPTDTDAAGGAGAPTTSDFIDAKGILPDAFRAPSRASYTLLNSTESGST